MKNKAFTLIEMIILIAVFSIGILTVLNLLTSNLNIMDRVTVRTQASFLAKEGIDLVYNMRDSNLRKELPWNCIVSNDIYIKEIQDIISDYNPDNKGALDKLCNGFFFLGDNKNKLLQVAFDDELYLDANLVDKKDSFDELFDSNVLYYNTGFFEDVVLNWYSNSGDEQNKTWFSRYILFTGVVESGGALPTSKILKLESHVLFRKGGKTGEVLFESFIGEY